MFPAPPRLFPIALGTALMAAVVVVAIGSLGYTRRVTAKGQVVPVQGMAMVVAPVAGVVRWLDATQGRRVIEGEPLGLVIVPRVTPGSGDVSAVLEHELRARKRELEAEHDAMEEQFRARGKAIASQLSAALAEQVQTSAEVEARRARLRIARDGLSAMRHGEVSRDAGSNQFEQQEMDVLDRTLQLHAARRQVLELRQRVAQLQRDVQLESGEKLMREAGFSHRRSLLRRDKAEAEAAAGLLVTAPVDGKVAVQLVKPGQSVQVGQPMLGVLPGDGRLEVELWVGSRAVASIAEGDKVRLRYESFPYQRFGYQHGVISGISVAAASASELAAPVTGELLHEPLYRVNVELLQQSVSNRGRHERLRPGMMLEADVLGERRRISGWLLEPLISRLRGHVE